MNRLYRVVTAFYRSNPLFRSYQSAQIIQMTQIVTSSPWNIILCLITQRRLLRILISPQHTVCCILYAQLVGYFRVNHGISKSIQ